MWLAGIVVRQVVSPSSNPNHNLLPPFIHYKLEVWKGTNIKQFKLFSSADEEYCHQYTDPNGTGVNKLCSHPFCPNCTPTGEQPVVEADLYRNEVAEEVTVGTKSNKSCSWSWDSYSMGFLSMILIVGNKCHGLANHGGGVMSWIISVNENSHFSNVYTRSRKLNTVKGWTTERTPPLDARFWLADLLCNGGWPAAIQPTTYQLTIHIGLSIGASNDAAAEPPALSKDFYCAS